jgi:hypothetical protein
VAPSGNVYLTGQFTRTNVFGGSTIISSNNTPDVFVAKIDPNGNWLWAVAAPGSGVNDLARAIVVDASENIYLSGEFGQGIHLGAASLAAIGGQDLFVAKIDIDGNWLLARRGGGSSGNDKGTALAIDAANQIYLLGQFNGTADYGGTLNNLNLDGGLNLLLPLNSSSTRSACAGRNAGPSPDRRGRAHHGDFDFATAFEARRSPLPATVTFFAQLSTDPGTWTWAKKIGSVA